MWRRTNQWGRSKADECGWAASGCLVASWSTAMLLYVSTCFFIGKIRPVMTYRIEQMTAVYLSLNSGGSFLFFRPHSGISDGADEPHRPARHDSHLLINGLGHRWLCRRWLSPFDICQYLFDFRFYHPHSCNSNPLLPPPPSLLFPPSSLFHYFHHQWIVSILFVIRNT